MRAVLLALIFCAPAGALRGTKDAEAERVPRAPLTKLEEGSDLAARVAAVKTSTAAAGLKGLDANPKNTEGSSKAGASFLDFASPDGIERPAFAVASRDVEAKKDRSLTQRRILFREGPHVFFF